MGVISQLKVLMRSNISAQKFDREKWGSELAPILNLWKKLNHGSNVLHQKLQSPAESDNTPPVNAFVKLEHYNAVLLIQKVHSTLASLAKVIKGTQLVTPAIQNMAAVLMNHE